MKRSNIYSDFEVAEIQFFKLTYFFLLKYTKYNMLFLYIQINTVLLKPEKNNEEIKLFTFELHEITKNA